MMELIRNAEFVRHLGDTTFRAKVTEGHLLGEFRRPEIFDQLDGQPYFVLFPGASLAIKRWPASNFAAIAKRLFLRTGWTGVICGGVGEEALGEEIERDGPPLHNAIGQSLSELVATLSKASFVLTNDTSALHIAACFGRPTVAILSGGYLYRYLPYQVEQEDERLLPRMVERPMPCFGCRWQCDLPKDRSGAAPCVYEIGIEQVWEEVERLLFAEQGLEVQPAVLGSSV